MEQRVEVDSCALARQSKRGKQISPALSPVLVLLRGWSRAGAKEEKKRERQKKQREGREPKRRKREKIARGPDLLAFGVALL